MRHPGADPSHASLPTDMWVGTARNRPGFGRDHYTSETSTFQGGQRGTCDRRPARAIRCAGIVPVITLAPPQYLGIASCPCLNHKGMPSSIHKGQRASFAFLAELMRGIGVLWQVALSGVRKGGATVDHQVNHAHGASTMPALATPHIIVTNSVSFTGSPSLFCRPTHSAVDPGQLSDPVFPTTHTPASPT